MKKVLSFVLVLAMILGSVSMAFAAPAKTVDKTPVPFEDAENSYVATILRDLGVLTGVNGEALLDETITRAELCAVLVRALGYDAIGKVPTATKFTDVDATAWYSGYIAVANTMGYVDGVTAKQFMPEDTVTGYEAVAFILKAVGYDAAHLAGSWPMNYVSKAYEVDLLDDFVPTNDVATRNDVFTLIFNGLDLKLVKWDKEADDYATVSPDKNVNYTLMNKLGAADYYYDVVKTLVAAGSDNHAVLGNDFDITPYIGKYVEIVEKGKLNGAGTPSRLGDIGLGEVVSTTVEGKFTIDYSRSNLTSTSFAAVDKTYDLKNAEFYSGAKLYDNAVATNTNVSVTSKQAVSMEVEFANGKIATIYSIARWTENAVKKINATEAAYFADGNVASYNAIDGQTYKLPTKDLSEDDDTQVLDEALIAIEGDATKLADIKENDIVEIYADKNNDIRKLVVTRKVVSGTVTAYDQVAKKFTVDGTKYSYAKVTVAGLNDAEIKNISASVHALYLNADGDVVYATIPGITKAVDDEYTYAFVLASAVKPADSSTLDATKDNYQVRLLVAGESEAKDYTNVTTAAMNPIASWTDILKAGTLAKVKFDEDGKIAVIGAAEKESPATKATGVAIGLKFENESKRYSDDVVVVEMATNAGSKLGKAENYVKKSTASLEGNTFDVVYVIRDAKTDFIDLVVFVQNTKKAVEGEVDQVTGAAFIGSGYKFVDDVKTTWASFYVNGEEKTYVLKDYEALGASFKGEFFNFKFDADTITTYTNITPTTNTTLTKVYATTSANFKLADNKLSVVVTASGATDAKNYDLDDVVTVYKKDAGVNKLAALDDVKKAKTIVLWDVDGDKYVDTILIDYIPVK